MSNTLSQRVSLIPYELLDVINSTIKCANQEVQSETTRKAIELFKEYIISIISECNEIRYTLTSPTAYTRVNNWAFIVDLSFWQRFNFTPWRLTVLDLSEIFTRELYRTENIEYFERLWVGKSDIEVIMIYNEIIWIALDKLDKINHS